MARITYLANVVACLILFFLSSTCMANYPTNTTYVIKNCETTPNPTLCLQTLVPIADRVDQDYKKMVRLAVSATSDTTQSTADALTQFSKEPNFWTREVSALKNCTKLVQAAKASLDDILDETFHLGGGSKDAKETKRQTMMNNAKTVSAANDSCLSQLKAVGARDVVLNRVQEATDVAIRQAANVYYFLDFFQF